MSAMRELEQATHAYVGYCAGCGSMTSVAVDAPSFRKENARFLAQIVKDGDRVGRVTIEESRAQLKACVCATAQGDLLAGAHR